MMRNIETHIDGNTLVIRVDLSKEYGLTTTGKNIVIASSDGNHPLPIAERPEILGLYVYKKKVVVE